ncbi:GNAT family N-acetyltransferase [Brachyspira aalborgi]|uniref:N-acetyltransferase n=1 Tax=Brachyspira aalborgi TaxID=29522 RepID=A0A5C8FDM0_9SPIR|nr:N-acetyltransferase [Brachyspira aalborgi]TXJ47494.1 N-acetyltransferase [Brachyspira aalborgi]
MIIRLEEEKDYFETENLTREAFWNVYREGCFEHLIIHNLRKDKSFVKELDYCIEIDNKIIANIVYAKGKLKLENGNIREILIFGPVSVLSKYQKKGYGEKLINYTIEKAKELGYDAIVIMGNPNYYKKFGFESCSKYKIYYEGLDKNEEAPFFMIKILNDNNIENLKGIYSAPDCYKADEKELEEFDKKFPFKIKEKIEGQIE